jgi:hypothetical protein
MKKYPILFIIFLMLIVLICGCIAQSQSKSQSSVISTAPTPKNQFKAMEPASDDNLKITVLGAGDGDRTYGNNKKFLIKIRLENLRSDKKIQILGSDFRLLSSNYVPQQQSFIGAGTSYDLGPGQWGEPTLEYEIPQNAKGLRLQFDFSGPSGKGEGGPIVYFNL